MYSSRRSPLADQGESSSGSTTSAASTSSSDPRSPSKPSKNRPQRPDLSTHPMESIQSFNAAYNAGPVYISEGLGSPIHGRERGSPNSTSSVKSNSPPHSRSSSLGSTHGMTNSSPQGQAAMQAAVMASQHVVAINTNMDIHDQLKEYQRVTEALRHDLENKETKLSSSMNSIKTFWSPELKKERALRKEEAGKIQALKEQCRVAVEENQQFLRTIQELKDQLNKQRDHSQRHSDTTDGVVQNGGTTTTSVSSSASTTGAMSSHEVQGLRADRERATKEAFLLRKTLEEMELRIETQKQTLGAREESIKKLLEMLQSKGLSTKKLEGDQEEMDRMRARLVESEARLIKMQKLMDSKHREENKDDMKSRSNGMLGETDDSSTRLKIKYDQLKGEMSLKVAALHTLQTKYEALEHRERDQQAHIDLLKESLAAKEQHSSILLADVETLRSRLEDKDGLLNRQEAALSSINTNNSKQTSEVIELREMVDLKERKIIVLQRKIDNLTEQLKERDNHAASLQSRISALQNDQTSSDSAVSSLEDALAEKDRAIDRLRAEKEREIRECRDVTERYAQKLEEQKLAVEDLRKTIADKEASFLDLKEHASTLASGALKKDSRITTLEIQLAQRTEEFHQAEGEYKKLKEERESVESHEIKELQRSLSAQKEEFLKSQTEVDRLLDIMKDMEGEKNDKDKRIKDLEGQLKDANKKLVAVKRDQQTQKRKNAQLLEDARRREGELSSDTQQLQDLVKEKEDRVEELAEALKESVTITADREMLLAQQTETISKLKKQSEEDKRELDETRRQHSATNNKLSTTQVLLKEKEMKLRAVMAEGRKHLEDALEMRQEALTAAIGEKDAHIALLELNRKSPKSSEELKLLKKEKDSLVQQLKDETQKRMKLLHNHNEGEPVTVAIVEHPPHPQHSPHPQHPQHPQHAQHAHGPLSPDQQFAEQFQGGVHSITL